MCYNGIHWASRSDYHTHGTVPTHLRKPKYNYYSTYTQHVIIIVNSLTIIAHIRPFPHTCIILFLGDNKSQAIYAWHWLRARDTLT